METSKINQIIDGKREGQWLIKNKLGDKFLGSYSGGTKIGEWFTKTHMGGNFCTLFSENGSYLNAFVCDNKDLYAFDEDIYHIENCFSINGNYGDNIGIQDEETKCTKPMHNKKGKYIKSEYDYNHKIQRDDLTDEGKEYVNKLVLGRKIVGLFFPWIFSLWGRFWSKLFGLQLPFRRIINGLVSSTQHSDKQLLGIIVLIVLLLSRIYIFCYGSENAFNNSTGYLKDMIIKNNIKLQ